MRRALVLVALGLAPASALAGPAAIHDASPASRPVHDFTLRALPPPTSLRMRRAQASASTSNSTSNSDSASASGVPGASPSPDRPPDSPGKRREAAASAPLSTAVDSRRTVFRFNLGVGLDGGEPARVGEQRVPLLSGATLTDQEYARLRIYYFGDAVIGRRGLMVPSLSTYLAAQFRFDQDFGKSASAVPSIHDADIAGKEVQDLWIRSAHAESEGFFEQRLLKPLYVRAGRQYRYGPAIAHFDGLTAGYENAVVSMAVFAGRTVDVTGYPAATYFAEQAAIAGLDARLDFNALNGVPLVWNGGFLRFDGHTHFEGGVALQWSPDIAFRAGLRILDSSHARTRLQVRARISRVTTVNIEFENRSVTDWMYDLRTIAPVPYDGAGSDSRTYLNLGTPVPRMYLNLRAGTVLLDNVDVLIHGGAAIRRRVDEFVANAHAPTYLEAGSAIEVRLRRALGVGLSVLGRRYVRDEPRATAQEVLLPDPITADTGAVGERSFTEAGTSLRYTQGARELSAGAELYMRYYQFQPSYIDIPPALLQALDPDIRGGGRFSVEAWAGERLRVKAEYDVSTTLVLAPELRGIKSLRVLVEGRF
jgi:hypothetical protein